jgi:lipopolysaccharide export system protein LptA
VTARGRFLRRFSTLLLIAWVGVLVGLFVRGQFQRGAGVAPTGERAGDAEEGGDPPIRVHQGFVYADTLGIEPNFRIATRETVQFASGWYELRDIEVSMYHRGEVAYGLVAEKARFNQKLREAHATGGAQVSLGAGVVVRADGFVFRGGERVLESIGPVTFAGAGWGGVGGGMRCTLADNHVEITGGLSLAVRDEGAGDPSLVLLAPTAHYSRGESVVTFPAGLTVLRGGLRLRGAGAAVHIDENASSLVRAALTGPVHVDGPLEGGGEVEASAGDTRIEPLGGGRYRVTAEAAPLLGWVQARWREVGGGWKEASAWRLAGEGSEAAWEWMEGQGKACALDLPPRAEPSLVESDRLRVEFSAGRPHTAVATGAVEITSGRRRASGETLETSLSGGTFALTPAPGGRVVLSAPEGEARCDRLDGDRVRGATARGQVVGQLREGAPTGTAETPVNFAARSASIEASGSRIVLDGEARLWQADRLMRADRLEYLRAGEQVSGRGQVLTTARQQDKNGDGAEVRIRSRAFDFSRVTNVAVYEGDVVLEDPRAESTCQRLVASLGRNGEVLLATLEGGVVIKERGNRRSLQGQRARLSPPDDVFEVWGSPVVAQEPSGNQIKGEHLRWLRGTDSVEIVGGADKPTETLYHPDKPIATRGPAGTGRPRGPAEGRRP